MIVLLDDVDAYGLLNEQGRALVPQFIKDEAAATRRAQSQSIFG